ncbi:cytochrome c [Fulvivirga sp. M361]|uniref:c-type cytochrome n=1 Tax=Fulvivirga sp. M361 TaxID=2594266 RepID=UPI00117AAA12|nr:cytochrome c [Fulvivirga sp. M361]TRX49866.1 cytochrome c [Fulvivirga sp. M361]
MKLQNINKALILIASSVVIAYTQSCNNPKSTPESVVQSNVSTVDVGESAYKRACMTCHQSEGQGLPGTYPPLAATDWVTGGKERLIGVVINGIQGEIEVNGTLYNGVMPPMSYLSDKQVADILTYVRNSFGNEASAITKEEVATVRSGKTLASD